MANKAPQTRSIPRLSQIKVQAPAKAVNNEIPTVTLENESVKEYNEAKRAADVAADKFKETRQRFESDFRREFYAARLDDPLTELASIRIKDASGETLRATLPDKYGSADPDTVDHVFREQLKVDPNDFVVQTTAVKVDNSQFVDENGQFDEEFYNEVVATLANVCSKHGKKELVSTEIVTRPKDDFHTVRWTKFTTVAQQEKVASVFPGSFTLVPGPKVAEVA